jgi:hypothetical protein
MTLDEKLRAYAAKGELVHISLAFYRDAFHANFCAASPASGYSIGVSADPVEAINAAFESAPIPVPRAGRPKGRAQENAAGEQHEEEEAVSQDAHKSLNAAWTTP